MEDFGSFTRIAGAGTKEFSAYEEGDTLDIMGPLGKWIPLKEEKKHS